MTTQTKQGEILKGAFCKVAHSTWWNCTFLKIDESGNYVVETEKGIKIFKPSQYYPNAIKSGL
jgi:hypothetical protein